MGELVEVLGKDLSNLWSGPGRCSSCMNKCNLAIFLIYLSAVFRLVDVFGRGNAVGNRVGNQLNLDTSLTKAG